MRLAVPLALLLPFALAACRAESPKPAEGGAAPGPDAAATETAEIVGTGVETEAGTVYGDPTGDAEQVDLKELVAHPDTYAGKRVRVAGMVTGVCAKRGCWINIGLEEGPQEVTFKVEDGVMVFPMSALGKRVEAEGTVSKIVLSAENAASYLAGKAKESGEEFDPASVTGPLTLVRLGGIGAVVSDARPAAGGE